MSQVELDKKQIYKWQGNTTGATMQAAMLHGL